MKSKDTKPVSKANEYSVAKCFDWPLFHVLTNISNLKLDSDHSKIKDILCAEKNFKWEDFDKLYLKELKKYNYNNKFGNKIEFNNYEIKRLTNLFGFKTYTINHEEFDTDPCT